MYTNYSMYLSQSWADKRSSHSRCASTNHKVSWYSGIKHPCHPTIQSCHRARKVKAKGQRKRRKQQRYHRSETQCKSNQRLQLCASKSIHQSIQRHNHKATHATQSSPIPFYSPNWPFIDCWPKHRPALVVASALQASSWVGIARGLWPTCA